MANYQGLYPDHENGRYTRMYDCKFYKNLSSRYEREKVQSGHLYQLTAYLRNASIEPGWENVIRTTPLPCRSASLGLEPAELNSPPELGKDRGATENIGEEMSCPSANR